MSKQQPIVGSLSKLKTECTVDNSDVGIHLFDLEMLLIRFSSRCAGDKVDLTQKRSCDGGIEEANPSKTHGPTQTYKLDDTTSEASSNRTSAMSTRNCTRENGTLECVKSQQDENHSWLFVVVLLCCVVTVYLPECFVVNTRELRQRCLV